MKKILRNKVLGFSLIEALIAALVVAIAMMGMAKLQGITLINSADSRMKTHALNLAQDKIEELRTFANQSSYTAMASGANANTESIMAGGSANFTRTWTITSCANSVNCKQVNVKVKWTDPRNVEQLVQLTSYIAGGEPAKSGVVLLEPIGTGTDPETDPENDPENDPESDPENGSEPPPEPTVEDVTDIPTLKVTGELTLDQPATFTFTVIGGAFKCNSNQANATTITRFIVDGKYVSMDTKGEITFVNTSSGNSNGSIDKGTNFSPERLLTLSLQAGQKVVVESEIISNNSCVVSNQRVRKSTDTSFVKALINDDAIPNVQGYNGQTNVKTYLENSIANGKININPNQLIYLFEHYTATSGSTYDLQDNAILITVNP
ncbi:MAG: hypothetical protein PSV18_07515 [Methylobacter sp.]|nr:hypothetical protein [Candidatus Methylobacter titanis]